MYFNLQHFLHTFLEAFGFFALTLLLLYSIGAAFAEKTPRFARACWTFVLLVDLAALVAWASTRTP